MPIDALGDIEPQIDPAAFVHPDAVIIGSVRLDRCLIGSGSVTLNGAVVGDGALVGASALVPEGFKVPPGTMALGVPCRVRDLTAPAGWIDPPMRAY